MFQLFAFVNFDVSPLCAFSAMFRCVVPVDSFIASVSAKMSDAKLTPSDFLLSVPGLTLEDLTKVNKTFLKNYKILFEDRGATIVDVQQNPKKVPRWGAEVCPTLTTGCVKMINLEHNARYSQHLSSCLSSALVSLSLQCVLRRA